MMSKTVFLVMVLATTAYSIPLPESDLQTIDTTEVSQLNTEVQNVGKQISNSEPEPLEKIIDISELFNEKYIYRKISQFCELILPHLNKFPTIKLIVEKIHAEVLKHSSGTAILAALKPIVEGLVRPVLTKFIQGVVTGIITAVYNAFMPLREAAALAVSGATNAGQLLSTQLAPQSFVVEMPQVRPQSFYIAPPQVYYRRRRDVQVVEENTKNDLHLPTVLEIVKLETQGRSYDSDTKDEQTNSINR